MGKKKIATAPTSENPAINSGVGVPTQESVGIEKKTSTKRHVDSGILYVESTYNNTKLMLADGKSNTLAWSSSGSLGFKGAKKGTPFAAAKVGEALALKAQTLGVKEVKVIIRGVGSGRESAIRGFISKGINLTTIQDRTAMPHNGPKPPKPRRT